MVECAEGQRWNFESRDLFLGAKLLEPERRLRFVAQSNEQSNALVLQAPEHVGNDSRRWGVQPLHVGDRDQEWARACERANSADGPQGSLVRLNAMVDACLTAQQRNLERVLLRPR